MFKSFFFKVMNKRPMINEKSLETTMNETNLLCRKIPIDKAKAERKIQRAEAFALTNLCCFKHKSSMVMKENFVKESRICVTCGKIVYRHYSLKHVVVRLLEQERGKCVNIYCLLYRYYYRLLPMKYE